MDDPVEITDNMYVIGDIVVYVLKSRIARMSLDIAIIARDEIVHHNHIMTFGHETIGQMTANKTGTTGDEYPQRPTPLYVIPA